VNYNFETWRGPKSEEIDHCTLLEGWLRAWWLTYKPTLIALRGGNNNGDGAGCCVQSMFVAMSRSYVDTLPRKRGVVVLTKQTIGRYTGHGKQSSAWPDFSSLRYCPPSFKLICRHHSNAPTTPINISRAVLYFGSWLLTFFDLSSSAVTLLVGSSDP